MATRPRLHFTAAAGWISDPLGLTYREGTYHLFFQAIPGATRWTPDCHWGHATSPDLLRWTEQPIALAPGDGDDGCWSGSLAIGPDGDAVLFYTSVRQADPAIGRVRRARPADPDWQRWAKEDACVEPPDDLALTAFRDPFVFRDRNTWRMLIGAGTVEGDATALLYSSTDLVRWRQCGPLATRSTRAVDPVWTGTTWDCPNLVSLGDKHVLVVSVQDQSVLHYVAAAVGGYADGRFEVDNWYRLTYGRSPYAGSAFTDGQGRVGLIAWLARINDRRAGWAGSHTIPTLLSLDEHGCPHLAPHPNVARRRSGPVADAGWSAGAPVDVEWSPQAGGALRLRARDGATLAEVSTSGANLTLALPDRQHTMPWSGGDIRMLLDGPIVEIFCAGALMAAAVSADHQRIDSVGGGALRCWRLAESQA